MGYFEFLNSVLVKNLEIHSSFFRIFYFKISQFFFKKSNLTNQVFMKIVIHKDKPETPMLASKLFVYQVD
jgi:hypothetical protein